MQDERVDVNKQDKYGRTLIWIASDNNDLHVAQAILQSERRNINLDTKFENKTALETKWISRYSQCDRKVYE